MSRSSFFPCSRTIAIHRILSFTFSILFGGLAKGAPIGDSTSDCPRCSAGILLILGCSAKILVKFKESSNHLQCYFWLVLLVKHSGSFKAAKQAAFYSLNLVYFIDFSFKMSSLTINSNIPAKFS